MFSSIQWFNPSWKISGIKEQTDQMNVGKSKNKENQLGTSSPWVLMLWQKAVWCHMREGCVLRKAGTVPRETWLYSVFLYGVSEWGRVAGVWTGHFQKSPYGLSHSVTSDSLLWVHSNTRMDSTASYGFHIVQVLSITLNAIKHRG